MELLKFLLTNDPDALKERYQIDGGDELGALTQIARIRACLIKGGEFDLAKAAAILLDDFRSGKLGRITLEFPPRES